MTYSYNVTLEINRFDINNANIHEQEIKTNEFSHSDPLTARNAAFNRALSYEDILMDSRESTEIFFKDSKDWYKEFNISVSFVDPSTNKDIILHETIYIDKNTGTYDELAFRQILNSLKMERNILEKNGFKTLETKNVQITFVPSNEAMNARILPTPFIKADNIKIQEILLD